MRRTSNLFSVAAFAVLALLPIRGYGQLTLEERKGLDTALYVANLTEDDLKFEKKVLVDPYRMPLNTLALDDPLEASNRLLKLHSLGDVSLHDNLVESCKDAYEEPPAEEQELPTLGPVPDEVPDPLKEPLEILVGAVDESNRAVHKATAHLSDAERRELIEGLPVWCAGSRQVHFGFTQTTDVSQERMLALLDKVDLPALRAAATRLAYVVESQLALLKKLAATTHLEKSIRFVIQGYRIELCAQDDEIHSSRDSNLFISFGDRNRFTGRFGAGIGYSSVLIDCGNQSYYDVPDMSIGAGVLGVGLAYSTGNGDVFKGNSICFGAGIAGVGGLVHEGSDASFRALALSEGFGCFGQGVLTDSGDRNTFHAELFSQGAARSQGLGWLVELGSNDTFLAGGVSVIENKNAAISCSQGYASGYGSEDSLLSGGVGLLTTTGLGESYVGGIRCQGAAVWGGVGSIYDKAARSSHTAAQEAQGYANHEAAAFVYNLGGFGAYATKFGTCEACAADSSVAFLLDRGGHDLYGSKDGRPASSMRNALSVFLTSGDDNTFMGSPDGPTSASGLAAIGLFCDVGVNSNYTAANSFSPLRIRDGLTVFFQSTSSVPSTGSGGERVQRFAPGSQPNPGETQLAALWQRAKGGGGESQRALQQLIAIGPPSVEYAFKKELSMWDPVATGPLAQLVRQIGEGARKVLALEIASSNSLRQQNALRIACLAPGPGMEQAIVIALNKTELQRLAAKAAGLCQVKEAVSALQPLCASQDAILSLTALVALEQIGDHSAAGTAAACLNSSRWPMRRAAIALISKFPTDAIVAATGLMASSNEQARRTGVQVIAALNSPESYKRLGHMLDDPAPAVQLEALIALEGNLPDDLKSKVADLQQSRDPLVKRVAEGFPVDR